MLTRRRFTALSAAAAGAALAAPMKSSAARTCFGDGPATAAIGNRRSCSSRPMDRPTLQ